MRVLFITGAYPPDKCGVGDYTYHLVNALASRPDIEVGVLTSNNSDLILDTTKAQIFRTMTKWRFMSHIVNVVSQFRPDIVHIQYPAQRYNSRLVKYLPLLFKLMRLPVVQTWHEHFNECDMLGWQNVLFCEAVIYVRPSLPKSLPLWVKYLLGNTPMLYISNTSTIPVVNLNEEQIKAIKDNFSEHRPIICFFGFAYPNKGLERLFEIADPIKHHLVLVCDLSFENSYQSDILNTISQMPWVGNVTVTGFLSAQRVGEILAVADAVVFPFPDGAGEWNTSLKAAEAAGAFVIATTQEIKLLGYDEKRNVYFSGIDDISGMRTALNTYLGKRNFPDLYDAWDDIAIAHESFYQKLQTNKN